MEDEETVQTKAWHYAFEILRVRGFVEGELAHPCWNCFKRAVKDASMDTSVLKLTVLSNFGHGSFTNGDKTYQNAASTWQTSYNIGPTEGHTPRRGISKVKENHCSDLQEEFEASQEARYEWHPADGWIDARTIGTRGRFAGDPSMPITLKM